MQGYQPPNDSASQQENPDLDRSSLKDNISFKMRSLIRSLLDAIEKRDCTEDAVFSLVRKQVLDKVNESDRDIRTLLDRYEVVEKKNVQQIIISMPESVQKRGIVVTDREV